MRFLAFSTPLVSTRALPRLVRKSMYLLFHFGLKLKNSVLLEPELFTPAPNVEAQLLRKRPPAEKKSAPSLFFQL